MFWRCFVTHKLTAAKVDKPAKLPQRSAAASRNEMHTDIVGARTCEVTADAEYAVRSMLTIARMPATPTDDAKWCATMLDYMQQQYDAGQRAANRSPRSSTSSGLTCVVRYTGEDGIEAGKKYVFRNWNVVQADGGEA